MKTYINTEAGMLDGQMLVALREMATYRKYPFRQATCKRLCVMGLARVAPGDNRKRPCYERTALGDSIARSMEGFFVIGRSIYPMSAKSHC